uniref:Putative carbohydrate kinase, FGGY family protein n=1 Tax=Paulinella longichromatophora TaxID=1708747 RepID=A0A2H4ZPY9_9EUKA|nr:putative carbohydrate kinase, FGGY family protein [Paulinella longichromatophora]
MGIGSDNNGVSAVLTSKSKKILAHTYYCYPFKTEDPLKWCNNIIALINDLPKIVRKNIVAISINHTQGSFLEYSDNQEALLTNDLSFVNRDDLMQSQVRQPLLLTDNIITFSEGDLTQILRFLNNQNYHDCSEQYLLRRKADWLMSWLLGNLRWAEESNNLDWGWNIKEEDWIGWTSAKSWISSLPNIVSSGTIVGPISTKRALMLGLPHGCLVIAGTSNDNAGIIATPSNQTDGITILNNRLSLNCFIETPFYSNGVVSYRLGHSWVGRGVSRAGTSILKYLFSYEIINDLSRQINPNIPSGLHYYPLVSQGEVFPISKREMAPIIEPRPISDSLYLHGLLEGLANIEDIAWKKMQKIRLSKMKRVITMGHGANNSSWRLLRQRILNSKVSNRSSSVPATGLALLALNGFYRTLKSNQMIEKPLEKSL